MNIDRLKSHIEWLRGDHEQCNPFLADDIEELLSELEKEKVLNRAMVGYLEGKPSNPPSTGMEKTTLLP